MQLIDVVSIIISVLIVAAVLYVAVRHGRLNPENTGNLGRQLMELKGTVDGLSSTVGGCATKGELDAVSDKLLSLEEHAASSGEIIALEGKINTLAEKVEGGRELQEKTWEAVDRMQRFFMEEGLRSMGGSKS